MERERRLLDDNIGEKITCEVKIPIVCEDVLIEASRESICDYYCALAEHLGLSPKTAKDHFEKKVVFKLPPLEKKSGIKKKHIQRQFILGSTHNNPINGKLTVEIYPEMVAMSSFCLDHGPITSVDAFLKSVEINFENRMNDVLVHELTHVAQKMRNPKEDIGNFIGVTVPTLMIAGGELITVFSNSRSVGYSIVSAGLISSFANTYRMRRQNKSSEKEAYSTEAIAIKLREETGIRPFVITKISDKKYSL